METTRERLERELASRGRTLVVAGRAAYDGLRARESFSDAEIRDLMSAEDVLGLPGMEWNPGGFVEAHEVRVTEPWRPSLVRLGERPRVALSVITRKCDHCHEPYAARRASSRYCGATCRQSAKRAR